MAGDQEIDRYGWVYRLVIENQTLFLILIGNGKDY